MITSKPTHKDLLILLCTFLLLVVPFVAAGTYIAKKHMWAQARLSEFEPKYARLRGLDLQREEIDEALARALKIREEYVYPVALDAVQTGNTVQQKVRDLLTAAGLTVVSSQVMPPKEDKGFDRIALSVRAEGELLGVDSALAALSEQLPVMLLTDVEVRNQGALQSMNEKIAPRLTLQLSLLVLRERQ